MSYEDFPRVFTVKHRAAIELLRVHPIAAVPRAVCHGVALLNLERCGLVEKTGIPGWWAITEAGRTVDLPPVQVSSKNAPVPFIPNEPERDILLQSFSKINRLKPGSRLFGNPVRQSALDTLAGRSRAQKFVYFAYPLGFPIKHIAWAVGADKPLWTDQNVNVVRNQVLRLPAMRQVIAKAEPISQEEMQLREELVLEGVESWEIEEYFAVSRSGAVL